ncbi:MAG: hypothetical protein LBT90_02205 [Holosporaceae bacterium]|jgi:hypothetical protein|nr:hypothetical protein [Holosporaceae bacterium]
MISIRSTILKDIEQKVGPKPCHAFAKAWLMLVVTQLVCLMPFTKASVVKSTNVAIDSQKENEKFDNKNNQDDKHEQNGVPRENGNDNDAAKSSGSISKTPASAEKTHADSEKRKFLFKGEELDENGLINKIKAACATTSEAIKKYIEDFCEKYSKSDKRFKSKKKQLEDAQQKFLEINKKMQEELKNRNSQDPKVD